MADGLGFRGPAPARSLGLVSARWRHPFGAGLSAALLLLVAVALAAIVLALAFRDELAAIVRSTVPSFPASVEYHPPAGGFPLCSRARAASCVVDGDTFRHEGVTIRLADIDAPEVSRPRCAAERALGDRATTRLGVLLGAGPYGLVPADRDEDRYGRKLRIVMRDGVSLGLVLVDEGLARRWNGARRPWC